MRNRVFCALAVIAFAITSWAGGNLCSNATTVAPDGRVLSLDYVPSGGSAYYKFVANAGHSYSIEVRDDLDPDNADFQLTYYKGSTCSTALSSYTGAFPHTYANTEYHSTASIDPVITPNGNRISLPNPGTDTYVAWVKNNGSTGHYVSITVAETTMFNAAWQASSNYFTYYAFFNTTTANIHVTLNFYSNANGALVAPSPILITFPPGGTSENTATSPMNLTSGTYGVAYLTHDGPPGAISITAATDNFSFNPPYNQSVTFLAIREAAH